MIKDAIAGNFVKAVRELYGQEISVSDGLVQKTRREFEGDYTINVFPCLKYSRKKPEATGQEVGDFLKDRMDEIGRFNVIRGFLNLVLREGFWKDFLEKNHADADYGLHAGKPASDMVVVEFSSPNTNKPLHLGHIRNNLLGWSVAEILKANGYPVRKVNLVNDRGIHICKTMVAWEKWAEGKTPGAAGKKGDQFVGDLYVRFDREHKAEVNAMTEEGFEKGEAEKNSPLMITARHMLRKWEQGDEQVMALWDRMNRWVYEGFDETYARLGIDFDKIYYESDTYLLGKEIVKKGLKDGVLFSKEDGSVWCDLSEEGLDEKLLLRPDGTSVYMTQDLGTARLRYDDFHPGRLLYVVGNEQNYHFEVLKIILKKLGLSWAGNITHISYGMVELPSGKMKSREGTVVDADDLMDEMFERARKTTTELGKLEETEGEEAMELFRKIGLGALKYFILKVDPKKNMVFNPGESIDFNGNTGPFIQYTYARIQSLLRKAAERGMDDASRAPAGEAGLVGKERNILRILYEFPETIAGAGEKYNPAILANYVYELAKEYNQFYQEVPVLRAGDKETAIFRILLSKMAGTVIRTSMKLLGIEVPERM
ncbi:MAG: arginine--tRNA ligase [Bacteroidales bacterium]